ncbi:hypothetical protein BDF21DRAFT_398405 [Thamnidium elegans]|nr:hypothetical protein BDF21DRAFT_398405 [Thamnidium elegans]
MPPEAEISAFISEITHQSFLKAFTAFLDPIRGINEELSDYMVLDSELLHTQPYDLKALTRRSQRKRNPNHSSFTETYYSVKVWSQLVEIIFISAGQNKGMSLRMGLGVLICCSMEIIANVGSGEFRRRVYSSKYYKDKLKTVLASKSGPNALVKDI